MSVQVSRRSLLLLLGMAGCASADTAFYTLRPVPGTPVPAPSVAGGSGAVKLARPGIAGYLDRPEIVRDRASNRLALRSDERWGEPLGDMIGRVLAEDLTQRLAGMTVFTEAGAISVDAAVTIELDVQRFDLDASGVVVMLTQVAVRSGRDRSHAATRSIRLTTTPTGPTTAELVTAMSVLVGQLADAVGDMVRGQRGETVDGMTPVEVSRGKRRRL